MLNKQWLALPLVAAISAGMVGCGDGGSGADEGRLDEDANTTFPNPKSPEQEQKEFCGDSESTLTVLSVVPANEADDVFINSSISVVFNAFVDPNTVDTESVTLNGGRTGMVSVVPTADGRTILIDPEANLAPEDTFTVEVAPTIAASCAEQDKTLSEAFSSTFTTGTEEDLSDGDGTNGNGSPTVVSAFPNDGESLAPIDAQIEIQFSEPMNLSSFSRASNDPNNVDFNFKLIAVQADGAPLADAEPVAGQFSMGTDDKINSIFFTPDNLLNPSEYYKLMLLGDDDVLLGSPVDVPAASDLAGNELKDDFSLQFRTGSLVVGLNDVVVEQIPVLGDLLNTIGGEILGPLEIGDNEDGLDSVDNLAVIKLPLSQDLLQAIDDRDPSTLQELADPESLAAFDSVLIAVCDPKSISTGDSKPNCVLSVDLGLDATQLAAVTQAAAEASPTELPAFFANAITDPNDGLGVEVRVLEDNSLFLPTQIEDALTTVLTGLSGVPVLGDLLNQQDAAELLNLGILDGEIIGVSAGELVSLNILDAEALSGGLAQGGLAGGSGIITGSGSLIDALGGAGGPLLQGLCSIRLLCPAKVENPDEETPVQEAPAEDGNSEEEESNSTFPFPFPSFPFKG